VTIVNTPTTPFKFSSRSPSAPATAQALFDVERLRFPPLPADMKESLRPQKRGVFATCSLADTPYDMEVYLAQIAARPDLAAYAVVGSDGRGMNSWAMHYYLVRGALALFLQLSWGGAYVDAEPARAAIADAFDWAAKLQSKTRRARQAGKIPPGWRLQVAMSDFGHSGWRWLAPGRDNTIEPWNAAAGMRTTLHQLLDDVLSGTVVL
jgi:hypothetical protein